MPRQHRPQAPVSSRGSASSRIRASPDDAPQRAASPGPHFSPPGFQPVAASSTPSTFPPFHTAAAAGASNSNSAHQHRYAYSESLSPYDSASPATFSPWSQDSATPVSGLNFTDSIWLATAHTQSHAQNNNNSNVPEEPNLAYNGASHSPQRTRAIPQPTIRVTHAWTQDYDSQPQDDAYPTAPAPSHLPLISYNNYPTTNMSHPYTMPQESEPMQTPVSPVSADNPPHDHGMSDQHQVSRKRSHSVMSQQDASLVPDMHQSISRAGSIVSAGASPNGVTDEFSPRGSRAFKRGEPPTNAMGKFICTFSLECEGQIFERKCEWSKHMDKHDRPYRCPHHQCAKLQGFTYSGGLLRHEREVHGKHGGPKSQLMCPHPDCKRHLGKGFTRKENLNEHLRRVHPSDKDSQNSILTRTATDGLLADEGETAVNKIDGPSEHDEYSPTSPAKRKRLEPANIDGVLIEDSEREIKRLRAEIAHRDLIIQQMQQDQFQHEQTRQQLHELQQQMHHQEQQQSQSLQSTQG